MITIGIESNIGEVTAHLERFAAGLDPALAGTVEPTQWLPQARQAAASILTAMAENPEEQAMVDNFVEAVMTAALSGGMEWSLESPQEEGVNFSEAVKLEQSGGLMQWANKDHANRAAQLIKQWVTEKKRKKMAPGERDHGKSDAEIAKGILMIVFGRRDQKRVDATKLLLPHLQEFADEQAEGVGLSPEKIEAWLLAVLDAWEELLLAEMPARIIRVLDQLWEKSKP